MKIEIMFVKDGSQDSNRGMITVRTLILMFAIIAALFMVAQTAAAVQWGVATSQTIVANSTDNKGHNGTLESDGTATTEVLVLDIKTQNALTSTALNQLSSLDGATSFVSSAGSAGDDEYVRLNMTLSGVLSVNYVIVKTQMRTTTDASRFGVFNYSTGKWIRLNETTASPTFTNFTYNISSTAEKNAYLSLSNGVLNFSLLAWGVGTAAGSIDVSYFEAIVNYNQVAELSGYLTGKSSGLPISGATVTTNTSQTNTTNASGFYKFNVINGTYIINASKVGYATNSTTVVINGADSLNNNISLSPFTGGSRLIVFTDKKTYTGWHYDTPKSGAAPTAVTDLSPANLRIIVYAIILDEDGNIMTGRKNALSGYANETEKLTPGGLAGRHHNVTNNPGVFGNFTLSFVDDGSIPEDDANDGIYLAIADLDDAKGDTLVTEHFKYNISVTDSVVGTQFEEVLISGITCMQSLSTYDHPDASAHIDTTSSDNCAVCHHGYEHWYENKSGTFRNDQLDIHMFKSNGIDVSAGSAQKTTFNQYRWNYSDAGGSGPDNWEAQVNGSKYCAFCHLNFTDPGVFTTIDEIFDYGSGDRSNPSDIPSCNNSLCHRSGRTTFENTLILPWNPSAMGPVKEGSNENITDAKSHNHSSTNPARVACPLCHGSTHAYNLPNTTANITTKPINEQCWLCHNITGGLNITSNGGTNEGHSSTDCKSCHKNSTGALDVHNVPIGVSGGANCTDCHTSTGTNVSSGGGKLINSTAMNSSGAIHSNLNFNAVSTGIPAENRKCWACHGNGSRPGGEHPSNYKTPFKCVDCHVNRTNLNYTPNSTLLNVTEHYWNGTDIDPSITACYNCHNKSEMMLGTALDPDGAGSVYSGANGGNNSSSHYGKKRTDMAGWNSSINNTYCIYCHNNASTVFPFTDSANKSIANHSANYPGTNPLCSNSTCHLTGRIHNSTLTKPTLAIPNSTYCTSSCHGTGGSAALTNNKLRHNNSMNCTQCHLNSSRSIHPVRYLLNINNTWNTSNTSAVNCTNCHQNATFWTGAPIIPDPLKHSSNLSNGSIWNSTSTPFWTSEDGACYYCHNNTKHNATALGRISSLLSDTNNTRNGSIITTTWCVDCHYNDSSNPNYKGDRWNPVPPLISINNTGKNNWVNHSRYFGGGYNDSVCEACHELNGSYGVTSLNYSHSLDEGIAGGPKCILCHNLVTGLQNGAPVGINFSAANASVHFGMNSNNATNRGFEPIVGACWACHDSDGNVTSGHPDRYMTPKTCTECHLGTGTYNASAYNAMVVSQHYYSGKNITAGNSTSNISSCINCHENVSEMLLYNNDTDTGSFTGDGVRLNGGNMSFYHYGRNRTELRTWNSNTTANCSYCHQNTSTAFAIAMIDPAYNRSISNHSSIYNSSNPNCYVSQCHNTGWIHNSTLAKPATNSTFCLNCHGKNTTSGLINFTGAVTSIKEQHNNSVNCTDCHLNTAKDVHPVKYLRQDATYSTINTSAVTCITCHQTSSVDSKLTLSPPKVPLPMHHSDNASNGTIWNSTPYWTPATPLTSCTYCHNDTKHNATALGRPAGWQGNNEVNSSLGTGTWCASCHYKNYATGGMNYSDMTQAFISGNLSVPPEITNGSFAINIYNRSNYYNHSLTDYSDSVCRLCHGVNLSSTITISELMHNVSIVNTCTDCHYSFEAMNNTTRPDRYVDSAMYNTSLHRSLSCTNCHTQGHRNIGARKACEDCHAVQADPITEKDRHNITPTPGTYSVGGNNVVGITDCTVCHNSALYNRSISTYGYWKPKDCDYCHTYPDKYYE